jgi:hypothetical protein
LLNSTEQCRALGLEQTSGVQLDQSNGAMICLGASLDLAVLIQHHNDPQDDYHINMQQVVCIGNQWSRGVAFMELTTLLMIGCIV